jgi:signal transduction histidine kinase
MPSSQRRRKKNCDMCKSRVKSIILYIYLASVLAVSVYLCAVVHRTSENNGFDKGECYELSDGWKVTCGSQSYTDVSFPVKRSVGEYPYPVTFERKLPDDISDSWYMAVPSSLQTVRVYVGGTRVENYNGAVGLFRTSVPANEWLIIKMKAAYSGSTVEIITNSKLSDYHGRMKMVYIGDITDVIYQLNRKSWPMVTAGLMLIISCIALWIMNAAAIRRGDADKNDICICEYLVVIGVWFIAASGMAQAIVNDVTLSRAVEFYSLMLLPVPVLKHVEMITGYVYHRVAAAISAASLCSLAVITYCVYILGFDFMDVNWITLFILGCVIVFGVVCFVQMKHRDPEHFRQSEVYIRGTVYFGFGAVLEIISTFIDPFRQNGKFIAAGAAAYLVTVFKWRIKRNERENEARERAIRQTYAKGTFLANMSHEIRTPVNAIISIDQMMLSESREANVRSYAEDIALSSRELLKLINKVLDSARIEYGKMKIFNANYNTSGMIKALRKIIDENKKTGVDIYLKYDRSMPAELQGDRLRICQIAGYLTENAAKHTDEGFIAIGIAFRKDKDRETSGVLTVDVADSGSGIESSELDDIFRAFRKDSRESGGMGLGLSLSRQLTEMMGGSISVRSNMGIGSLFRIDIPQTVIDPEPIGQVDENPSDGISGDLECFNGLRTLIVDDSPINLKIMKAMFDEVRAETYTASSGPDALVSLNKRKYDIVFMDHIMPGMNGEEVFDLLRRSDSINRSTPVIMLTAEDDRSYRVKVGEMGFSGVLLKPVAMEAAADIVRTLKTGGTADEADE